MPKQPAFPGLREAMNKTVTRREPFLAEMDVVVPRGRLPTLIAPHHPKAGPKGGRPPMPLETMLRVDLPQNRPALSDPIAEETPDDSAAMRRFAGIEPGDDRIPDETTILNFRHLLERHGPTEAIFAAVNAHPADTGITLRSGTLVDASRRTPSVRVRLRKIIDAPSSTRNKAGARDPEMSSTGKRNDWHFGMKQRVCPQIMRFSASDQSRRFRRFVTKHPDSVHHPIVDTIPYPALPAERSDRALTPGAYD